MASMQQIKEAKTMDELKYHLRDTVYQFELLMEDDRMNPQVVNVADWTNYVLCHSVLNALNTIEGSQHEGR
jgi:hypothetical protein